MNGHLLALYVVTVFLAMIAPGPDMMFVLAPGARRVIFAGFEVLVDSTVGLTAGRLGNWLSRRRRARQALDAGSGTIMVLLAGRLALEAR